MYRRWFDRPATRLPDVVGLGAEKCGSTSLYYYLRAHPEIGVQRRKETQFFAANYHRGLDWYRRQFPDGARVLFEAHGGDYAKYPRIREVPERIYSVLPEARFVYIVRDPIERIVSRWIHHYSNGDENQSLEDALAELDGNRYVVPTLYFEQIGRYLRYFPADRFHIFTAEEFRDERMPTLRRLFRFLGVDDSFESAEFHVSRHLSAMKRRNNRLGVLVQRAIGDRVTGRLHGRARHLFKRALYTPVSRSIPRPQPSAALRRRLREYFAPDVRRLEEFTGRRFPEWLE